MRRSPKHQPTRSSTQNELSQAIVRHELSRAGRQWSHGKIECASKLYIKLWVCVSTPMRRSPKHQPTQSSTHSVWAQSTSDLMARLCVSPTLAPVVSVSPDLHVWACSLNNVQLLKVIPWLLQLFCLAYQSTQTSVTELSCYGALAQWGKLKGARSELVLEMIPHRDTSNWDISCWDTSYWDISYRDMSNWDTSFWDIYYWDIYHSFTSYWDASYWGTSYWDIS